MRVTGGTNTWLVPLTVSWGTCPPPGSDAYVNIINSKNSSNSWLTVVAVVK